MQWSKLKNQERQAAGRLFPNKNPFRK
eukprot:COSAG01_NODE_61606_length_288_cov_2.174603_1_plen_26_part_01